ncbi:MAG: putative quinol monooxygenase [Deferrisomatales bacterium]|nr:putative quinol monooxygenase [Deferrisomatales bacterium]
MEAKQVTVIARCKAKPGREEETRQEILALVGPTRSEAGCLNYDLHVSTGDPGLFLLYENWRSMADLDRHLATPYLERFKVLAPDLLAEPIDIALYEMITAPGK